jgi:hypothetical protein
VHQRGDEFVQGADLVVQLEDPPGQGLERDARRHDRIAEGHPCSRSG